LAEDALARFQEFRFPNAGEKLGRGGNEAREADPAELELERGEERSCQLFGCHPPGDHGVSHELDRREACDQRPGDVGERTDLRPRRTVVDLAGQPGAVRGPELAQLRLDRIGPEPADANLVSPWGVLWRSDRARSLVMMSRGENSPSFDA